MRNLEKQKNNGNSRIEILIFCIYGIHNSHAYYRWRMKTPFRFYSQWNKIKNKNKY